MTFEVKESMHVEQKKKRDGIKNGKSLDNKHPWFQAGNKSI